MVRLSCPRKRASILRWIWIPAYAGMTLLMPPAHATPPSEMHLAYQNGTLNIEARHMSENLGKHYLRRLVVYKNDAQEKELTYIRQASPPKFIESIPLDAVPGDVLAVEVFCVKGGSKRAELIVPSDTPPTNAPPPVTSKPAEPVDPFADERAY